MPNFLCALILVFALAMSPTAFGEVDESPLAVDIVPAFPQLKWPGWLTNEDSGKRRPPLPVLLTGAGDGTNRIFVVSQYGVVFVFENSPSASEPKVFLDISDNVSFNPRENEEGFLGLAFHPKFKENGEFFVYYTSKTDPGPRHSIVSRFKVSPEDPNRAVRETEERVLVIPQPYWNHNGGTIAFGPDGYLYIALGDGGAGNDPHMHGQNLQSLFASILRIDIDHKDKDREGKEMTYAIPKDNPFVGQPGFARGEIWAYGLRNVWRFSFDRETGTCWAGDVGQNTWEEIDIIVKGGNYGWNLREGAHPFGPFGSGPREDLIEPIWDYGRKYGMSITGGCVYRGTSAPELEGAYLYADYISGHLWALWYDFDRKEVIANRTLREKGAPVIHYGEDDQGEVYFTTPEGDILKFVSPSVKVSQK